MQKVLRGSLYFLIILVIQLLLPIQYIFNVLEVQDPKVKLFISHTLVFLIPAIIYILVTNQSIKKVLRLNKLYLKDIVLIIILGIVCQPMMTFFSAVSQMFFTNEIGNAINFMIGAPYIILVALIALMPAITEEITIRGIILSDYEEINTYIACISTGILFGLMHLDAQQFLYTTVLGIILAFVVKVTNSIFASALIHFIVNGTSITIAKLTSGIVTEQTLEQAEEVSFSTISIQEQLMVVGVWGVIGFAFAIVAYFVIKKLVKNNIERGIINKDTVAFTRENKLYRSESSRGIYIALNSLVWICILGLYVYIMNL